jgi:predicted membrane metal-binding protein
MGRKPNVLSALSNAALLHAIYDPFVAFNISFLLSYVTVAGIILIGLPLQDFLFEKFLDLRGLKLASYPPMDRFLFHLRRTLIVSFSISFSGHLVSLPISAEYFGTISLLTIPVNILAVPIAGCAIVVGAVTLFFGLLNFWPMCAVLNKISCFLIYIFCLLSQGLYCDSCCLRNVKFCSPGGAILTALILICAYVFAHGKLSPFQQIEARISGIRPPLEAPLPEG